MAEAPRIPTPAGGLVVLLVAGAILFFLLIGVVALSGTFVFTELGGFGGLSRDAIEQHLDSLARRQTFTFATLALQGIAMVGCTWLIALHLRGLGWRDIGLRPVRGAWIAGAVALGVAVMPVGGLVASLVQGFLGRGDPAPQLQYIAPEGVNAGAVVAAFVVGGIALPFAEEVFFRGLVFAWLRRCLGLAVGAVVSAVIFGLVHNIQGGLEEVAAATAVVGVALALAYEYSGSLWVPYVMHATFNLLSLSLMFAAATTGAADAPQETDATGAAASATAQAVSASQCSSSAAHSAAAASSTAGAGASDWTVTTAERVSGVIALRAS